MKGTIYQQSLLNDKLKSFILEGYHQTETIQKNE